MDDKVEVEALAVDVEEIQAPPHVVRMAKEQDINFILSSWMKSYRKTVLIRDDRGEPWNHSRPCKDEDYYNGMQRLIAHLAQRSLVLIACAADDPDTIYAWVCVDEHRPRGALVVHYIYCKSPYRQFGFATELMRRAGYQIGDEIIATCWTGSAHHMKARVKITYNPYLLFKGN